VVGNKKRGAGEIGYRSRRRHFIARGGRCGALSGAGGFAELEKLTRENREALEGIRQLVGKPTAGGSCPGTGFANEDKMRELGRLVVMANALEEMTVSAA